MKGPKEIINDFYYALEQEYDGKNPFLDSEEYRTFRKYYYDSLRNKARRYLYKNLYQNRLRYITNLLLSLRSPLILDAGCGLGSESILFSSLGAKVVSVDLNEERLKVAEKRKLFYKDLVKGRVEFIFGDVFEIIKMRKFDIVWMNESISHIHPAEEFLQIAHHQLNSGGRVIISETNGGNPYILLKRFMETGSWSWRSRFVKDPKRGSEVGYAVERLFTFKQITNILMQAGYFIGHVELTHFIPIFLIRNYKIFETINRLEKWLEKKKFNRGAALSYRIEGKIT